MSVERGGRVDGSDSNEIAGIESIYDGGVEWAPGFCAHAWFEDVHRLSLATKPVDLSIFAIERFREVVLVLRSV